MPDSIYSDSVNNQEYQFGDTISILIDGFDTVFTIFEDTTANFFVMDPSAIYSNPSGIANEINQDLYGINVSSMFQHAPEVANAMYTATKDPWTLLTELKPKILRFPDGSGGKFSRLLGSENLDPTQDDFGTWNGGYGFNLAEIIPYYDYTDGVMSVPPIDVDDVIADYIAVSLDLSWIAEADRDDFETLISQYVEDQEKYDPSLPEFDTKEEQPLYINQFIKLVQQIEAQDPTTEDDDYRVDVILCLDVINETAQQNLAIIDYLRNDNGINVIGVEIGNEIYSKFYGRCMGFTNDGFPGSGSASAFEHFWDYINGGNYSTFGFPGYFDLSIVLPAAMEAPGAHDYIGVLNSITGFTDIAYGIPAENNKYEGAPFITSTEGEDLLPAGGPLLEWNEDLYNHYANEEGTDNFAFDAVILHPYYTPISNGVTNVNWREIPLCLDANAATTDFDYYTDLWDYVLYDEKLRCAFDKIVGIGEITGNFRTLIKTRHKQAYLAHNAVLHFDEFETYGKKLWTTESNLLDVEKEADLDVQQRLSIFTNSFVHTYLLQEWFLRNIKMNYYPEFINPNFYNIATWQNYIGGSSIDFLFTSDKQDQIELEVLPIDPLDATGCDEPKIDEYFVARTTYYTMQLLSQIASNGLDYLSSNGVLSVMNLNLAPAFFIDEDRQFLYVYYTNMKPTAQKYIINPANLLAFYPYADAVRLDQYPITIYSVDAAQLYSTSGRNALYVLSTDYALCEEEGIYANRFEIEGITTTINTAVCSGAVPPGGVCVAVPGYSAGYFKIQLSPFVLRLGEMENVFTIYPNPASNSFTISSNTLIEVQETFKIEIIDATSKLISAHNIIEGQNIDISMLPVGIYTVLIYNAYNHIESEQLIKMQ